MSSALMESEVLVVQQSFLSLTMQKMEEQDSAKKSNCKH